MTERKFHKTIITVEVLSEEPYDQTDLNEVAYDITEGHCSGKVKITSTSELTGKQAADELKAQGSDTEFFLLDENGDDIEDENDYLTDSEDEK